jgi:hypothetical protein
LRPTACEGHDFRSSRPRFSEQSLRAAEQQRPDVQEARQNWPNVVLERQAERLIFLDETWFTTAMSRLYGYALRGERLVDYVPHGHWKPPPSWVV